MMAVDVDWVHVEQRTFRALLRALAHPGRVTPIEDVSDDTGELGSALALGARALLDADVAVWISAKERTRLGPWLVAQTGCRLVVDPMRAQFAVILDPGDALPLDRWNSGEPEEPENSVTLLMRIDACAGGTAVALAGPGIERDIIVGVRTLPQRFWLDWSANTALYPLGIDCLFFDESNVVGLPRTAKQQPV